MTDRPSPFPLGDRAILEALGDAVIVSDASNTIVWANEAAGDLLDWGVLELLGQPLTTIIPERFHAAHLEGFQRYVRTREARIMNRAVRLPARRRDGSEVPIELVLKQVPGVQDTLVVGSLRSLQDRVELEVRSTVVSRLLEVLAEGDSLAVAAPRVLGAIGEVLDWDYAALWVVDWHEELIRLAASWSAAGAGMATFEPLSRESVFRLGTGIPGRVVDAREPIWIPDLADDPNIPRLKAALADGLHTAFAFPVRVDEQVLGVIELFSTAKRGPEEQLLDTMSGIGDHLGRFLQQRLAEEVVRASRERLDLALDAGRLGTWEWDLQADVMHWFDSIVAVVGDAGPSGRPFAEALDLVHPDDRAEVERSFRAAAADGGELLCTYRVRALDDGYRWFEARGRLMRDAAGRPLLAGVAGDVTERMEAQRQRDELLGEVQAAQERLRFLAEAGDLLASSLDHQTTLGHVARLTVPRLADWCLIHGLRENGDLELLAVAHRSGGDLTPVQALHERYPALVGSLFDLGRVMDTGEGVLYREVTPALLRQLATDGPHLAALEALGWQSVLVVPLEARGRTLGALTWATSGSERRYGDEDLEFAAQLASRAAIAVDNARLYEDQAATARTLQESLLPPHLPAIPGIEVAADYRPGGRNQVAGDFYDLFPLRGDAWGIVIGDVRGKGAQAAAVTALARWTIRAAAMQASSPPRVLSLLNDAMLRRMEEGEDPRFCTVLFARLQTIESGIRLTVANGGHPLPLVLRRSGRVEELGAPGLLVGAFADGAWYGARAELTPGDVVLLYTDGVTEARVGGHELFGEDRLHRLLEECAGLTAAEIVSRVTKRLADVADLRDDLAILALRVRE